MDTLIARFVTYIEEEAPKRGEVVGLNKVKSLSLSSDISKEEKSLSAGNEIVKSDVQSGK